MTTQINQKRNHATKQHYADALGSNQAKNYERFFVPAIGEPVAKDLMQKVELQPGERVLDVACGTGTIAQISSQKVSKTGSINGLDINPGMLAVARKQLQDAPLTWHEASAEEMPFADEKFDVVICQMGIQFMENRSAALQEMYRVLVPGGRLVINVPGPAGPVFKIFADALNNHINKEAAEFVHHVFSLHDTSEIQKYFEDAGFKEIVVQAEHKFLELPAPKQFLWQYILSTPLIKIVSQSDQEAQNILEQKIVEQWQQFQTNGNMQYRQRIVSAIARK